MNYETSVNKIPNLGRAKKSPPRLALRVRQCDDLTDRFVASWRRLALRSLDPNPFLNPDFVLPLLSNLAPDRPVNVASVEDEHQNPLLVCLLQRSPASTLLFSSLQEYRTPYQFRGGVLVSPHFGEEALRVFLWELSESRFRHGLSLELIATESELFRALSRAADSENLKLEIRHLRQRASVDMALLGDRDLLDFCSKNRRKSLRQAQGKLERHGVVEYRAIGSEAETPAALERFLLLEQAGWKNETGTAINCHPSHRAFFVEMATRFAKQGSILFFEALVNGEAVASSCNLISGDRLFAFKIGWNPEYRTCSPGMLSEVELVRYVQRALPGVRLIDSCSNPGSYLEQLWPHRISVGNVTLSRSRRAWIYASVRDAVRSAKQQWRGAPQEPAPSEQAADAP